MKLLSLVYELVQFPHMKKLTFLRMIFMEEEKLNCIFAICFTPNFKQRRIMALSNRPTKQNLAAFNTSVQCVD